MPITCQPGAQAVKLHLAARQGDYEGRLKNRHWNWQLDLPPKPARVNLNDQAVTWRVARVNWQSATAQASEV